MKSFFKTLFSALGLLDNSIASAAHKTDTLVDPIRKSTVRRFPVLFLLLVTFGVSATVYGMERLIERVSYFDEHPVLVLLIGVLILFLTGKLYKKLG